MNTFDFSPLFRSTVGFDRLQRLLDAAQAGLEDGVAYPPYNIEAAGENAYRITMAVAGFAEADIEITARENQLIVTGKTRKDPENTVYLHRGIAGRSFERRFQLADHIRVDGAQLVNGLLHIELVREVPEALKPRKIAIKSEGVKVLEQKAA